MQCDNFVVVAYFLYKLKSTQWARYIHVKHYKVNEKVAENLITIEHMLTCNMV